LRLQLNKRRLNGIYISRNFRIDFRGVGYNKTGCCFSKADGVVENCEAVV